jgi:hypothetical protein
VARVIASVTAARERLAVLCLGTAAAYGALAQGGYYGPQAVTIGMLVGPAAAAAVPGLPRIPRAPAVAALCWLLLGLWSLARGVLGGDAAAAVPAVAFACCLAGAAIAAAGLSSDARRVLLAVVLATAAVVATSCWVGVALHLEPLALPSGGLWRGASTITYPNATAAFLVIALVLVVVLRPVRRGLAENGLTALLLLAVATTLSRAGAVAVVVACAVAVALRGRPARARIRELWSPVAAAAAAFTGLLPALPVGSPPRPLPALAGLLAGVAVIVLWARAGRVVFVVVTCALLSATLPAAAHTLNEIASTRLTPVSAERADLTRVTAEAFWSAPLTGVGPGQLDLRYVDHAGERVRAVHAHDEYLQTAAETGLVGLGPADPDQPPADEPDEDSGNAGDSGDGVDPGDEQPPEE